MASKVLESEAHNFFRLVSLIVDTGSGVLRKLLMKHVMLQTTSLDKHLANNKTTLETLQNKRRILNQKQMDLLFPQVGTADVESFDITLLSCLLRNICGTLTQQERQEMNKLRIVRNELCGHIDKTAVGQNEFNGFWAKITCVIISLAKCTADPIFLKKIQDEITDLLTKPKLRPASEVMELLIQWHQNDKEILQRMDIQHVEVTSELERLKTKTSELHETLRHHDPAFDRLKTSSHHFLLSHTRNKYVHTQRMCDIETKLGETGSCVISGKPGEGKTIAATIVMERMFNLKKCLVICHPREWDIVDVNQTEAVFIDDIFGIYQLDEGILSEWLHVLDRISSCTGTEPGKIKLVIATRENVLKECHAKVSRFAVFNAVVELSSGSLLYEERKEMLELMLQYHNRVLSLRALQRCVEEFTSPIGFPFCCQLFSSNPYLYELGSEFFRRPFQFFVDNVATLDVKLFSALVFLFYRGGIVKVAELKDSKKQFRLDLKAIAMSLDIGQNLTPSNVKAEFKKLDGVYVMHAGDSIQFIHNSVGEAVGLIYGKSNPRYVLCNCSAEFLHQCVVLKSEDCTSEGKLMIPASSHTILAERLIKEVVEERRAIRTAAHPALRDQDFVTLFVQVLKTKRYTKKVFGEKKDPNSLLDGLFLTEYVNIVYKNNVHNGHKMISDFLNYFGRCKHTLTYFRRRCYKCKMLYECMNISCRHGEYAIFNFLLSFGVLPRHATLDNAIKGGDIGIVRTLLAKGLGPRKSTLNFAVEGGKLEIVKEVLNHGNEVDLDAETLRFAIQGGRICSQILSIEQESMSDSESMNSSVWSEYVDILKLVLERGAVPDAQTVAYAAWGGNIDIVKLVMEYGAVPNTVALNYAVRGGNINIVRLVMGKGALPDASTLRFAANHGNVDIVKLVLEQGVVPDLWTLKGAIISGNCEIVRCVIAHGGTPDTEALNWTVQLGNEDIINVVVQKMKNARTWAHEEVHGVFQLLEKGSQPVPILVAEDQKRLESNDEYWWGICKAENTRKRLEAMRAGLTEECAIIRQCLLDYGPCAVSLLMFKDAAVHTNDYVAVIAESEAIVNEILNFLTNETGSWNKYVIRKSIVISVLGTVNANGDRKLSQ